MKSAIGIVGSILADVLDIMQDQIDESKLTLDCKGGGRMRVDPQKRTISVYGYSMVSLFNVIQSRERNSFAGIRPS